MKSTIILVALVSVIELVAAITSCYDHLECQNNVIADDRVYCYGAQGCKDADIDATIGSYCHGLQGCMGAQIKANSHIYGNGQSSLRDTDLSSPVISSKGYWGLRNANIDTATEGLTSITVTSNGVDTGKDALFSCRKGSSCTLNCDGTGCEQFKFDCYKGATCTVTPTSCTPALSGTEQDCAICPDWSTGL